jgi:hypothetical protein
MAYELKINVKKGVVVGGGLANNAYVEVWIDGMLVETTASVPSPPEWNKEVIKDFDTLEPATPIIISFSMYKKRWTSEGYKLVGTAQMSLSDMADKLNKGPVNKVLNLNANKRNITLSGTLQIVYELRDLRPADDEYTRESNLTRRMSGRISKGGGAISKILALLTPPPKDLTEQEVRQLGPVSRAYRYVLHFDNQVFGRFVKLLVMLMWLVVAKYTMDLWVQMKEDLTRSEARVEAIHSIFQYLLAQQKS